MKFQEEFFIHILGIVIGTNLAPILANIHMAIQEEESYMFKIFIDDWFIY